MSSLFSVLYKENVFTQLQSVAHCPDDNIVVPEKDPKKKKESKNWTVAMPEQVSQQIYPNSGNSSCSVP